MSIHLGNTEIGQIYLGSTEISEAYLGGVKVFDSGSTPPPTPYDAEIEYLKSDSSAYIDTGIGGDQDLTIELKYRDSTYVANGYVMGNVGASTSNMWRVIRSDRSQIAINTNNLVGNVKKFSVARNIDISVIMSKTSITVNGSTVTPTAPSASTNNNNIVLFNSSLASPVSRDIGLMIYYCKIYLGSTLLRDFIPVRVGTTGYMYDNVSGQLFGNVGTGSFVLGNDINT